MVKMILLIILLLLVVGLGVVCIQSFWGEQSLNDTKFYSSLPTPEVFLSPTAAETINPDWKTFTSEDHSFRFRYPPDWRLVKTSTLPRTNKGVYGMTVQFWELVNFDQAGTAGTELPKGAIKLEFEILTEGRKQSLENLLDCQGSWGKCQDLVINSLSYRQKITEDAFGQSFFLVALKDDRIYRVSGVVSKEAEGGIKQVERITGTFEVMQET